MIYLSDVHILCIFIILRGVDLVGEIVAGIYHAEGMAQGNKPFEGTLIKNIDEFLFEDHLVEFLIQGCALVCRDLLNANRLSHRVSRMTGLANFRNAHAGIHDHLHLLLTTSMPIDGQG